MVNVSAKKWDSLIDTEFRRVAEAIFGGTFTGDMDPGMVKAIAQRLHISAEDAMKEFYKGTNLKFNPELGAKLERNAYGFSAAKNFKQLLFLKSMKESGVPKAEFMEKAMQQNNKFNHMWLKTEEGYAKGAAQSAARWNSFGKDSWLKYRTSNDERVRNDHRLLNGIVKPIQDTFWDTYYPPNGYNCRCLAIETTSRDETDINSKDLPEVNPFFENNVGKQEVLFPGNHPYFKGVTEKLIKEGDRLYMKAAGDQLLQYASEKFVGKMIFDKEIVNEGLVRAVNIELSKNSFSENLGYSAKWFTEKLIILKDIDKWILKSEFKYSAIDNKGRKDVRQFHYFRSNIDGKEVQIDVIEYINGKVYVYFIKVIK